MTRGTRYNPRRRLHWKKVNNLAEHLKHGGEIFVYLPDRYMCHHHVWRAVIEDDKVVGVKFFDPIDPDGIFEYTYSFEEAIAKIGNYRGVEVSDHYSSGHDFDRSKIPPVGLMDAISSILRNEKKLYDLDPTWKDTVVWFFGYNNVPAEHLDSIVFYTEDGIKDQLSQDYSDIAKSLSDLFFPTLIGSIDEDGILDSPVVRSKMLEDAIKTGWVKTVTFDVETYYYYGGLENDNW